MTTPGITERNHAHEQADLHEILRLVSDLTRGVAELGRRLEIVEGAVISVAELVEEFRPLIDAYRQTAGGTVGVFRARKALRNGNGG